MVRANEVGKGQSACKYNANKLYGLTSSRQTGIPPKQPPAMKGKSLSGAVKRQSYKWTDLMQVHETISCN
eukprot:scaffold20367_cov20-Tisochrysis_lutea.AAC.3